MDNLRVNLQKLSYVSRVHDICCFNRFFRSVLPKVWGLLFTQNVLLATCLSCWSWSKFRTIDIHMTYLARLTSVSFNNVSFIDLRDRRSEQMESIMMSDLKRMKNKSCITNIILFISYCVIFTIFSIPSTKGTVPESRDSIWCVVQCVGHVRCWQYNYWWLQKFYVSKRTSFFSLRYNLGPVRSIVYAHHNACVFEGASHMPIVLQSVANESTCGASALHKLLRRSLILDN